MTIKLYRHALSGHSHRVELMLSLLNLDYELIDVDLANGAHKQVDFLHLNPFGQVPVIDDGGRVLSDSNAILVYLATKYDPDNQWLPTDPARAAEVQRFLSIAAGQIAFGPAAARLVNVFGASLNHDDAKARAADLLGVLETTLTLRDFLAKDISIADIAGYTYIAHAPEGDVDLAGYPAVRGLAGTYRKLARICTHAIDPGRACSLTSNNRGYSAYRLNSLTLPSNKGQSNG